MAGTLTPSEQKTFDMHQSDSIFSSVISNEYERIETLKNKAPGTHTPAEQQVLRNAGLDDFVSGNTPDAVNQAIDQALSNITDTLTKLGQVGTPAANYATNIGKSILSNKPIEVKQSDVPQVAIDDLVNNIPTNQIGFDPAMHVGTEPVNYSDENFYVDDNGKVHAHTTQTLQQYPNNTTSVHDFSNDMGPAGINNSLAAAGQAQMQFVYPKDGSEPYMQYTDHAYHNVDSSDPGEVPDPIKKILSGLVHTVAGHLPGDRSPNTGGMAGYPPNIRGDVVTNVRVPISELPPNVRNALNDVRTNEFGMYDKQINKESFNLKKLPRLPRRTNKVSTIKEDNRTLEVIKNIKKPVVIEEKTEKVKRRPRVIGSEPRTINSGLMKQAEVPASFKRPEDKMWGKYEQQQNARASQDRKNVVLDHLGNADQAWEYLLDRNANKRQFSGYFEKDGTPRTIFADGKVKTVTREEKIGSDTLIFFNDEEGKNGSILQSELNELQDQSHTQQMFAEYEATVAAEEETSFDRIVDKLELKAEKNPTNDKIESMLSSYRALSHLKKEDKKHEAHFVSWKSSIDGTIANNFQSWVDSVGQETADAVTEVAVTEGMSSANLFGVTLPATGDVDQVDMTFDSNYLDPSNDDIVNGAGSGTGYQGGFPVADGRDDVIQLDAFGEYSAAAYTVDQDLTFVDTLSVTSIAGNGNNGGITPINGLKVYFVTTTDFAGPFDVAPASQSSYANNQINIPKNMRTKGVSVFLYSDSSEYINGKYYSVRHFGNETFNVPGLDYTNIRNIFPNEAGQADAHGEDFLSFFFTRSGYSRNNPAHMNSIGHYYWYNVNAQRFGLTISGSSMADYVWAQWPPAPVSGNTVGNPDGTLNGVPTEADYTRVGEMIWDQFVGTKLWGISKISFKRKAPASVYVPLDSPEAINFIRTDPSMQGLTPTQRLNKLKKMLKAGNEALLRMIGYQGSTATPGPNEPADYLDGADELLKDVSPQEQAEIEKNLSKLGPEYAKIAAIPVAVGLLATPAGQVALAAGGAAIGTLLIKAGIDINNVMQSTSVDWDWSDSSDQEQQSSPVGDLKDQQRSEAQEAEQALQDAIDQYGEGSDEEQEARQAKNDTLTKHKKERKSLLGQKGKNDRGKGKEASGMGSQGDTRTGSNDTWYGEQTTRKGRYLSDSKTFNKKSFAGWYSSMESNIADKVISDTKKLLDEKMSSANMFTVTLPAEGDVDLVDVDVSNADTWYYSSSSGTTVSSSGLSFDQRPSNIYSSNWALYNLTTEFDATLVNSLEVSVTAGTGVDTPFAANPLKVEWVSDTDYGVLGTFSASGGTQVFQIPKEANVNNLVLFYSVSGNGTSYRTYTDGYLVGQSIFGGDMDSDMSQSAMGILDMGATPNTSPSYPTVDDMKALFGFGFWIDALTESRVTALKNGSISGPLPPSWGGVIPPALISYGFNRQDQIDVYNAIHNLYSSYDNRASNLYTITATNFKRTTPMNVFVSLDSPEAINFIRTDPSMRGLTPTQRVNKLKKMLESGNEYLLKALGYTGSTATPGPEVAVAPGPRGMDRKPGSYDPSNIIPIRTPGSNYKDGEGYEIIDPFKNSPATGPGLSKQGKDYGNVAQAGMKAPHSNIKYDKNMKQYVPDNTNADQILLDRLKKA